MLIKQEMVMLRNDSLIFAWREANGCAHELAKIDLKFELGELIHEQAPLEVLEYLRK